MKVPILYLILVFIAWIVSLPVTFIILVIELAQANSNYIGEKVGSFLNIQKNHLNESET